MKFSKVNAVRIPKGTTKKIRHNGKVLWTYNPVLAHYVSLGDSIAAGHTIDENWDRDYGYRTQYGENGNTETVVVPNCYTDLIHNELRSRCGGGRVVTTSFARSGDTVADLISKLDHALVKNAIAKADYVTVCIGANDVLQPAMTHLDEYINTGDLSTINNVIATNLSKLNDDNSITSYRALFNKLSSINPNAKYVFTTVYNPYKYLWIEEGRNGFFGPLLNTIPDMSLFSIDIDGAIKDGLLSTPIIQQIFSRINGLNAWTENYVTQLNSILRNKINAYQSVNPNFILADTKAVFDPVPDRVISAPKHYNDLVSVEYTRGYDTMQMDWGKLYEGTDAASFWWNLVTDYVSWSGLDINGFANELVPLIVEKVIVPDIDPHPEWYGHYAMKCSFADALGWSTLTRHTITYNANNANGSAITQKVVALDNMTAYTNIYANSFSHPTEGYYFTGLNAKVDGSGTAYTEGQFVGLTGDLILYAQWSNIYAIQFRHSKDSNYHDSSNTGPMECYALWIDGVEQADLGAFSNDARIYYLPYGTSLGVIAQTEKGSGRSYVTYNGTNVHGSTSSDARWGFTLVGHTDIHFEWNYWLDGVTPQSYWNCYITTT